jgi:alpha-L-arabinofuranosidase
MVKKMIHEKINPGIFGINVALWDGDLLNDQTIKYVKDVDHGVLRYPGGLRADEDHWFEVLEKQDWMVDTDEIVEFAKNTNTGLMITVNGGRGTAEQAADWVEHVNIKRKANVKYWEIGNELYGNWHPNQMTGDAYGKMCADYAQKMKAVDPTIFITAVWTLHGPWNEAVFKHCAPYVDGVNVHHYPQHYGEENDSRKNQSRYFWYQCGVMGW